MREANAKGHQSLLEIHLHRIGALLRTCLRSELHAISRFDPMPPPGDSDKTTTVIAPSRINTNPMSFERLSDFHSGDPLWHRCSVRESDDDRHTRQGNATCGKIERSYDRSLAY